MKPGGGKKERNPKHHSTQTNPVGVGGVCVYVCGMGGVSVRIPWWDVPKESAAPQLVGAERYQGTTTILSQKKKKQSARSPASRLGVRQDRNCPDRNFCKRNILPHNVPLLPPPWYHLLDLFLMCAGAAIWIRLNTPPRPPKTTLWQETLFGSPVCARSGFGTVRPDWKVAAFKKIRLCWETSPLKQFLYTVLLNSERCIRFIDKFLFFVCVLYTTIGITWYHPPPAVSHAWSSPEMFFFCLFDRIVCPHVWIITWQSWQALI